MNLSVVRFEIPRVDVVAEAETVGHPAVQWIGQADRHPDDEIAVENVDVVDVVKLINLLRLDAFFQRRQLLLAERGGRNGQAQ
ncbi:MAG TPA: hypothetical protein VJZ76_00465 [Thermoanaerobaculia bacterium]|nr:hypothetical protein [Thermoanaerobaculia bacterium]